MIVRIRVKCPYHTLHNNSKNYILDIQIFFNLEYFNSIFISIIPFEFQPQFSIFKNPFFMPKQADMML